MKNIINLPTMRTFCSKAVILILVHIAMSPLITTYMGQLGFVMGCHEPEREALLKFKGNVSSDPANRFSSWKGDDCCSWRGITCHNVSRHVLFLDLHTDIFALSFSRALPYLVYQNERRLTFTNLNPCLVELKELKKLDLSGNSFGESHIPEFVGSMKNLRYLNFSGARFGGFIPSHVGNLTKLQTLDLGYNDLGVNNLKWVSTLSNLRYLDLSGVQRYDGMQNFGFRALMETLLSLPSLLDLRLSGSLYLGNYSFPNLTLNPTSIIQHLDLSYNFLGGSFPNFLLNMSSLKSLDLSYNYFRGAIPLWLKDRRGLEALKLRDNLFSHIEGGSIMGILENLCNLKVLDFAHNQLGGDILSPSYENYSANCVSYELEVLDLSLNSIISTFPDWFRDLKKLKILALDGGNKFNGPIPQFIGNLSLLEELHLSNCGLNGSIPSSIRALSSLTILDLSPNSLQGLLSDSHFSNLSSLKILDLSLNPLNFNFSSNWLPKFQLKEFRTRSCKIKGIFPQWLRTQKELRKLDLSENEIYGELPRWYSTLNLSVMNLSYNQIVGQIPHFSTFSQLSSIDLSYNSLSGLVTSSLCELRNLSFLDLQSNQLYGPIPDCWGNSEYLNVIDFSSNKLYGDIPMTLGLISGLEFLKLNNNSLEGKIPTTLHVSSYLVILDLGDNKLTGEVPNWRVSTHPTLEILRLRANQLTGVIPPKLCSLSQLTILDLAQNNLTGSIPRCFGHFKSMKSSNNPIYASSPYSQAPIMEFFALSPESSEEENAMVVFQGAEREYTSTLKFVVDLDLSCNGLSGPIPIELTQLILLKSLNLSYNHLTGFIPNEIGEMKSLISLDLSKNYLSGTIPYSLSLVNSLSYLNLSCNKLHGEIPTGPQLQTLNDPSIYANNVGLCGDPLPPCGSENGKRQGQEEEENDEGETKFERVMFILVVMLGFATGFWGVIGSLKLNKTWRHALFGCVEKMSDFLHVQFVLRVNRLKK